MAVNLVDQHHFDEALANIGRFLPHLRTRDKRAKYRQRLAEN
jgi:hypothetical protein